MEQLAELGRLVGLLGTQQVRQAEAQLTALCCSRQAVNSLRRLLLDPDLPLPTRQRAAAFAARLLLDHAHDYEVGFAEKYLLAMMTDQAMPAQVKKMLVGCLRQHARRSQAFLERLVSIAGTMAVEIHSARRKPEKAVQGESSELDPLANEFSELLCISLTEEELLANYSETIIVIGEAIVPLIIAEDCSEHEYNEGSSREKEEESPRVDCSQPILSYVQHCSVFHEHTPLQQDGQHYPHLLSRLFKVYQQLADPLADPATATPCLVVMAGWWDLALHLKTIYGFWEEEEGLCGRLGVEVWKLRFEASLFHTKLVSYLLEHEHAELVGQLLSYFLQPLRKAVLSYDATLPDAFHEHLAFLLYYNHLAKEVPFAETMADFQNIVAPLITRVLIADRFEKFIQSPAAMYDKLSGMVEGTYEDEDMLMALSNLVRHLVQTRPKCFLFLFQNFRYCFEERLGATGEDTWTPPHYILAHEPLQLITAFYLMALTTFEQDRAQVARPYLTTVFTPAFVGQLDYMQLAVFYLFLEWGWAELYLQVPERGRFLLECVFREVNPSAKYFLYEFVDKLADSYIDRKFILAYVAHLPRLYDYPNKWSNVAKWLTYLQDLGPAFTMELVGIVKTHITNEIMLSVESNQEAQAHYYQLKNYYRILVNIAGQTKIVRKSEELQRMLLEEYMKGQGIGDEEMEGCLEELLGRLAPFFALHQDFYSCALGPLVHRHAKDILRASSHFYYLLAEYIYFSRDTNMLMFIFEFADAVLACLPRVDSLPEIGRQGLLLNIANALILLQNLLVRHVQVMQGRMLERIKNRVEGVQAFLFRVLRPDRNFKSETDLRAILARSLNVQLALLTLEDKEEGELFHFNLQLQRRIHRNYDARFAINRLAILTRASPPNRKALMTMLHDILHFSYFGKEEDEDDEEVMEQLLELPRRMTPVFDDCRTVFRQAKKMMSFYGLPPWDGIQALDFSTEWVAKFMQEYQVCEAVDRRYARSKANRASEFILMTDENGGEASVKRRRTTVEEEEDEREAAEKGSEDEEVEEGFRKRVKGETDEADGKPEAINFIGLASLSQSEAE